MGNGKQPPGYGGYGASSENIFSELGSTETLYRDFRNAIDNRNKHTAKNRYLNGPYLGIAVDVMSIEAAKDVTSYYGAVFDLGSPYKTLKLRVYVPEMDAGGYCTPFALPGDDGWKADYYQTLNMAPIFSGVFAMTDERNREPKIGDIVAVEYHNENRPQEGGKYLGIAYAKGANHDFRSQGMKDKKAIFEDARRETVVESVVVATSDAAPSTKPSTKDCSRTPSEPPHINFLDIEWQQSPQFSSPRIPHPDGMLYGQICMMLFGPKSSNPYILTENHKEVFPGPDLSLIAKEVHLTTPTIFKKSAAKIVKVHDLVRLPLLMVFRELEERLENGTATDKEELKNFEIHSIRGWQKPQPYPGRQEKIWGWGLGIEINKAVNHAITGMQEGEQGGEKGWQNWKDKKHKQKLPDLVISIFKYYGFRWGGHFPLDQLRHPGWFDFVGLPSTSLASYVQGIKYMKEHQAQYPNWEKYIIRPGHREPWNDALNETLGISVG